MSQRPRVKIILGETLGEILQAIPGYINLATLLSVCIAQLRLQLHPFSSSKNDNETDGDHSQIKLPRKTWRTTINTKWILWKLRKQNLFVRWFCKRSHPLHSVFVWLFDCCPDKAKFWKCCKSLAMSLILNWEQPASAAILDNWKVPIRLRKICWTSLSKFMSLMSYFCAESRMYSNFFWVRYIHRVQSIYWIS